MIQTKCRNGHYFDGEEYIYCPVCGSESIENDMLSTKKREKAESAPIVFSKTISKNIPHSYIHFNDVIYNTTISLFDMNELIIHYAGHSFSIDVAKKNLSYWYTPYYKTTLILGNHRESVIDNDTMNLVANLVNRLCSTTMIKLLNIDNDYNNEFTYIRIITNDLSLYTFPQHKKQISGDYRTLLRLLGNVLYGSEQFDALLDLT